MFGELLSSYLGTFKLGLMSGIILLLVCLTGVQTLRLHWSQDEVHNLVITLEASRAKIEAQQTTIDTQVADLNEIQKYYRARKPIDYRDGELQPDETTW